MGEKRNTCRILVGKPEGNRHLRKPRWKSKDNIIVDLRDDGVVWTGLIWLRIGSRGGTL
jgi:hypothetical protein